MAGSISRVVASLVLRGLADTAPEALADEAAVRAVVDGEGDGAPLGPYRRILEAAYASDGGRSLLAAGTTLRTLQHPLLFVLLNSSTPEVLIEKEARLASFFHSRHRVTIEDRSPTHLLLRHGSLADPPEPAENLASCGQHLALLEEIGCRDLRLRFPASTAPERWVLAEGSLH
ncbi:MAG: hypothetical protein AAF447_08085, partial [Myxococcota bacterium]